jgi:cytoskeletal protein RodZ
MPTERRSDLGARLKEARERRGLSLRQIANDTKISVSVLEALERNDISRLPGGIFSRSFVRTYAAEVGLDVEETVEDFVNQFPQESVTVGHPSARRSEEMESFESDRRVASVVLWLLLLSVPLVGLVLYLGLRVPATAGADASTPVQVSAAKPEAAGGTLVSPLRLEIVATRPCTVSVAVDGEPGPDLALDAGDRRTFDVRTEATIKSSDAGAFEWTINGRIGRPAGPAGAPASLHFTAENYQALLGSR